MNSMPEKDLFFVILQESLIPPFCPWYALFLCGDS